VSLFSKLKTRSQSELVHQQLKSYGRLCGASVSEQINAFPGWDPARQMTGKLLKVHSCRTVSHPQPAIEILTRAYGEAPKVYSVHAGLECGLFIGAYPEMECISIGPIIEEAHTPQERCNIPSVATCYQTILELAKAIPK
jgi:dipeptidase D